MKEEERKKAQTKRREETHKDEMMNEDHLEMSHYPPMKEKMRPGERIFFSCKVIKSNS